MRVKLRNRQGFLRIQIITSYGTGYWGRVWATFHLSRNSERWLRFSTYAKATVDEEKSKCLVEAVVAGIKNDRFK
jgi:hypothetical protein